MFKSLLITHLKIMFILATVSSSLLSYEIQSYQEDRFEWSDLLNIWNGSGMSLHQEGSYAQYLTFTLNKETKIGIELAYYDVDTWETTCTSALYLLSGADENGTLLQEEVNSSMTATLPAGTYTLETTATENHTECSGDIDIREFLPPVTTLSVGDTDTTHLDKNSTHRPGLWARYYTLVVDKEMDISIEVSGIDDMDENGNIIDTVEKGYIYLISGTDLNGTVLAKEENIGSIGGLSTHLSTGIYTIELASSNKVIWDVISIIEVKEETFPVEQFIDLMSISERTPSTHQEGSYSEYRTYQVEEGMYVAVDAWFFDWDTYEMSEVQPYLYLLKGKGKNGEIVAEGDSIMTYLPAGIYTIETTTKVPGIIDGGEIILGRAYPWLVPVITSTID